MTTKSYATDLIESWRRRRSSRPGTIYGGPIVGETIEFPGSAAVITLPDGSCHTTIGGGTRQYIADVLCEPPIANLTAVTATTETILWNVSNYSPINANDCRPGKIYRVMAGGIVTTAASGTLTITPRFGLTVAAGITMGASGAQTVPVSLTNVAWTLQFICVGRTVGAPGVNSTVIGTGDFQMSGTLATAGSGTGVAFGGTSATVDVSIATGICIGWTLSVAGSVTPQFCFIQSLN